MKKVIKKIFLLLIISMITLSNSVVFAESTYEKYEGTEFGSFVEDNDYWYTLYAKYNPETAINKGSGMIKKVEETKNGYKNSHVKIYYTENTEYVSILFRYLIERMKKSNGKVDQRDAYSNIVGEWYFQSERFD